MQPERGDIGWAMLIGGIVYWDLTQQETLSHASHRYMEHPIFKFLWAGAIGMTALHLLGVVEPKYDPFYLVHLERQHNETS